MNCESNCKIFLEGNIAEIFHYLEIDKYFLNRSPKVTNIKEKTS